MSRRIQGQTWLLVVATLLVLGSHGGMLRLMQLDAPPLAAVARAAAEPVAADTIELHTEGPNLAFMPDHISAKNGTQLTIRYTNNGALPHNFVLFKNDEDIDTVGPAAFNAEETGYVPMEYKDKFIAFTELAKPGTTVEVTFVVPEPGEYVFVCLYPGHYNMMVGTLRSLK